MKLASKVERIGKRKDDLGFIFFLFFSLLLLFLLMIKWRETDEDVLERIYIKEVFSHEGIYSCSILKNNTILLRLKLSFTKLVILILVLWEVPYCKKMNFYCVCLRDRIDGTQKQLLIALAKILPFCHFKLAFWGRECESKHRLRGFVMKI